MPSSHTSNGRSAFAPATKTKSKLRLALIGPSGSGKTWTALEVAGCLGTRIAVIDTEHGSASKYADNFHFDTLTLPSFEPQRYIDAIHAADAEGYEVLVIDSLSHAWAGPGGILEFVDQKNKASKSGNSFAGWRDATPLHNLLVSAIVGSKCHVIATMRAKTEWVVEENDRGKKVPRKIGLAPVQRDGLEYEFDVAGDIDLDHSLVITKSRCPELADKVIAKPGAPFAETLKKWLGAGVDPGSDNVAKQAAALADAAERQDRAAVIVGLIRGRGLSRADVAKLTAELLGAEKVDPTSWTLVEMGKLHAYLQPKPAPEEAADVPY